MSSAQNVQTPLRVPPSPFLKRLGYGAGVSVFEMARSPRVGGARSPWAIKRLVRNAAKDCGLSEYGRRLLAEADLLRKMDHPNVVGFRRLQEADSPCLAMEKCENSLGSMIEDRRDAGGEPYEPRQILKMALDTSAALHYLHVQVLLLHADVKSFNILVNGDFEVCKLCDFGVSLPLKPDGTLAVKRDAYIGTGCWAAPEALHDRPITDKTDIFSFGLTVWEMMSLDIPHSNFEDTKYDTFDESISMDEILDDSTAGFGTRPELPDLNEIEYKDVLSLFYCTTEDDPNCRPSASHVNLFVKNVLTESTNKEDDT